MRSYLAPPVHAGFRVDVCEAGVESLMRDVAGFFVGQPRQVVSAICESISGPSCWMIFACDFSRQAQKTM